MAKKISDAAMTLWRSGTYELRKRLEREAAAMPNAPLADKMFGVLNKPLLRDNERQHVSPLGGVAKPARER
jgi:hypothetical protein